MAFDANVGDFYSRFYTISYLAGGVGALFLATLIPRISQELPRFLYLRREYRDNAKKIFDEDPLKVRTRIANINRELSDNMFGSLIKKDVKRTLESIDVYTDSFGFSNRK